MSLFDRLTGRETRLIQESVEEAYFDVTDSNVVELGGRMLQTFGVRSLDGLGAQAYPPDFGAQIVEHPERHDTYVADVMARQAIADLSETPSNLDIGQPVMSTEDRQSLDLYNYANMLGDGQTPEFTPESGQIAVGATVDQSNVVPLFPQAPAVPVQPNDPRIAA